MRAIFALAIVLAAPAAWSAEGGGRSHGGGREVTIEELPHGRFRASLDALPPHARANALAWLARMTFHDQDCADLNADRDGGIFYACGELAAPAPAAAPAQTPLVAAGPVPIASQPSYHSRPGATRRIYLDFNGGTVSGTSWNSSSGVASWTCKPYDTDGDPTTFGDAEQTAILHVWERVSEDYAPFDVDVTTDPALEGALTNQIAHVQITSDHDVNGVALPSAGAGGVAYISVFGTASFKSSTSPAFVYFSNLGGGREDYVAEACSHETGHNVGLSHDGTSTSGYYLGHGSGATSWAPIMGAGYNRNVTQFSKGEYFDANQTQDDLAIISGYLPYRADDYGDTDATATQLTGSSLSATGVIGRTGDIDVVKFACGSGAVSLTVSPFQCGVDTLGGNLDVKLVLVDSGGATVATADPAGATIAAISVNVAAGTYCLRISAAGEGTPLANPPSGYTAYASLGQWTLSGSVPPTGTDSLAPTASCAPSGVGAAGGTAYTFTVTYADDVAVAGASLGAGDVRVDGPNAFSAVASFVSVDVAGDGPTRVATYRITPPGGAWDGADNGTYSVVLLANAVTDVAGNAAASATLGSFVVACPVPTATVTASDASASEAGDPGAFTVALSSAAPAALTVAYTVGGTASAGSDYTALSGSVGIAAGASSATIAVAPLQDTVFEGSETVVVTLTAGTGYAVGAPGSATVTIADDEAVPVATIAASDASASEAGDPGAFTVTLSRAAQAATSVAYAIGGSATAGSDYAALSGSVSVPAQATSATIALTPLQDAIHEGSETVVVTLSPGSGYSVGAPGSATVTIADDDAAPVASIAASDADASEGGDPGAFTISLSRASQVPTVIALTVGGTATPGSDYVALPATVTIAALATSAVVPVSPRADSLAEAPETVTATLASGSGYTVGAQAAATVTIADGPPPHSAQTSTAASASASGGSHCGLGSGLALAVAVGGMLLSGRGRRRVGG